MWIAPFVRVPQAIDPALLAAARWHHRAGCADARAGQQGRKAAKIRRSASGASQPLGRISIRSPPAKEAVIGAQRPTMGASVRIAESHREARIFGSKASTGAVRHNDLTPLMDPGDTKRPGADASPAMRQLRGTRQACRVGGVGGRTTLIDELVKRARATCRPEPISAFYWEPAKEQAKRVRALVLSPSWHGPCISAWFQPGLRTERTSMHKRLGPRPPQRRPRAYRAPRRP